MNPIYKALLFFGYTIFLMDLISILLDLGRQSALALGLSIVVLILSVLTISISIILIKRESTF